MSDNVIRGRIKVDARRALHKLRDHMLVDLHLYATEIARAAVALDATRIDIDYDADDVILCFDGRPLSPSAMTRVRDYVLTPDANDPDSEALRSLGIGITAALGLNPVFVEVEIRGATVRFTKSYIDDEESDVPPLEDRTSDGKHTTRVMVRRRIGFETITRAFSGDVPREVLLLQDALADAPLAVFLRNKPLVAVTSRKPLLRVDLDEPSATRAFLEVFAPAKGATATTVWLEQGIRLAETPNVPVWGLDQVAPFDALPLRLVTDARRLPTNASRFAIQNEADLVKRVMGRLPGAFEAALDALEKLAVGEKVPVAQAKIGHHVEVIDRDATLAEDALGAIAIQIVRRQRQGSSDLPPRAKYVLRLPLLRSAVGDPLTIEAVLARGPLAALLVHEGAKPLPKALAPWLESVVWRRGRWVDHLFAEAGARSAEEAIAVAREGYQRKERALAHPPSPPVLSADASTYLLKEAFEVTAEPFAGLCGEVAIVRRQGNRRPPASARLFVDDRLLATMPLPGVALPIEIALSWPGRIVATRAYDGVEQNEDLTRATLYALRLAALAVAERLEPRDAELVRLAIAAFVAASQQLFSGPIKLGDLAREAVWPTREPGVLVSIGELEAYVRKTGALCVASSTKGRAPDGRPVLDAKELPFVKELLPEGTKIVLYDRALAQPASAGPDAVGLEAVALPVWIGVNRGAVAGIIGVSSPSRIMLRHAGILLDDKPYAARNGPVVIALEDAAAIPTADWKGTLHRTPVVDLGREEDALLEIVVERCERGELDVELVLGYVEESARQLQARLDRAQTPWLETWWPRVVDLPARAERERLARLKNEILARPPTPSRDLLVHGLVGTTVTTASNPAFGTVTATLPDHSNASWVGPPADLLYAGRLLSKVSVIELPLALAIDVVHDDFIYLWASLGEAGMNWARASALEAAVEILRKRIEAGTYANETSALGLTLVLLEKHPTAAARVRHLVRLVQWPTIQGGAKAIAQGETVPWGSTAYASYRGPSKHEDPSPYDAPAVHLPQGELGALRMEVITELGHLLRDVNEPVERLQERRRSHSRGPAPKLSREPLAPALRTSLAALGATIAEGELEIVPGIGELIWVGDDGETMELDPGRVRTIRAIFRSPRRVRDEALKEVRALGETFAIDLGVRENLDELPPFVRELLRAVVCHRVSTADGRIVGRLETIPVFPETRGGFLTLGELTKLAGARMTTDGPPYPPHDEGSPIVYLTQDERDALSPLVRFADVTSVLRAEKRGAERRAAPPVPLLALSADTRARCLGTIRMERGDVEDIVGEVGILAPSQHGMRGIHVHHTMRPLATIADGEGWPIVAVVDSEEVLPNRAFDAVALPMEAERIVRSVRTVLANRIAAFFRAPIDALAVMRLPFPLVAHVPVSGEARVSVPVIGVLWLTRDWPERPELHVEAIGVTDPFRLPRLVSSRARSRILPVSGKLYIACEHDLVEGAIAHVCAWAQERLPSLVEAAGKATINRLPADVVAAYEWDFALSGTSDKRDVDAELAKDRLDEIFVRVAVRRAPALLERVDEPASPKPSPITSTPIVMVDGSREVVVGEPPPSGPVEAPDSESFFRGLVRRIVELVSPAPPTEADTPIVEAIARALGELKLTGDPIDGVVGVRSGRPIRYDTHRRAVIVNVAHETVRALSERGIVYLVAAAVSEINRELEPVTDAEERAILMDLLRANEISEEGEARPVF